MYLPCSFISLKNIYGNPLVKKKSILRSGKICKHISMILLTSGDCEVRVLVEKGRNLLYSKDFRKFLSGWKRSALVARFEI